MTQRRNNPDATTNYFDRLLDGIGHRGSSFCDVDRMDGRPVVAITHDGQTHRFLLQEFKREGEPASAAQSWLLECVARVPEFTVWVVVKMNDGSIVWLDVAVGEIDKLSEREYQDRFRLWWRNQAMTHLQGLSRLPSQAVGSSFEPKS
jgi:hypothetical protein